MNDIGALETFPEESVRVVTVGKREIGVIRWHGDQVYAIHNRCPHMGGPLCRGALSARLAGAPGCIEAEDVPVIACSWHHWEFNVVSGRSLWDDHYRVKTYAVEIRGGRVFVEIG